jgi:hypothetical protein
VPIIKAAREVGPGGTVRFAVGSRVGLRSSAWRIWSAKNSTDVYLAARAIAGVQKISLHESGSWSYSFISEQKAAPFIAPGASRHVDIWQSPPEFGRGWRRGFAVIVPWTELRVWPEVEEGAIEFAPHPGHGHWVTVEIVLGAAGTTTALVFDEMYALGSLELVDGSEVKVIARRHRPTSEEASQLAMQRGQVIRMLVESPKATARLKDRKGISRAAVYGELEDGTRAWMELGLIPPPPGQAVICTGSPVLVGAPEPS